MHFTSLALASLPALAAAAATPNCFPYGSAKLPGNMTPPSVKPADWWCPQSMAYGFQGFSYPLEDDNCNSGTNSFNKMNQDFAKMKKDFGASIVRMYYPTCTKSIVFENAIRAAATNNMGIILQVWTNFGGGDVWRQSQQAIYDALNKPEFAAIAPYVVHSADWGSEPVGDGMDSGNFVNDLGAFRAKMKQHSIKVGISEDWDRPGTLRNGNSLTSLGSGIKANSDFAHIHPMPFYHGNNPESQAWAYIQQATQWVLDHVNLPTMITESPWAWGKTDHNPGKSDVGVAQYTKYWKTFDDNCEWFKQKNVGWFLHAWQGEDKFDIVKPDGSGYVIPNWRPRKC
ncbi:B-(1-6) glucan synthase [Pochonia chlamydosporia 170]|uniref:glucan endo-1,3-beta-D-glucosidase n=1 Tax=Pochonia chlamydosporia 170 TaxID=1380566 RepID=A0A179FS78_METCM|nr:B-(1-6) glucan synthase [Pochonia chlamydosporia 170]OAQ68464.1 B-(1-6) glucan synthase [Pochonia chlamydosporia 170]